MLFRSAHAQAALEQEGDAFKVAKGLRAGAGARWRAGAGVGGANGGALSARRFWFWKRCCMT